MGVPYPSNTMQSTQVQVFLTRNFQYSMGVVPLNHAAQTFDMIQYNEWACSPNT